MTLADLLLAQPQAFSPMFAPMLTQSNTLPMDLSSSSREFTGLAGAGLDQAIQQKLDAAGVVAGVGGYLENRSLYRDTELFQGDAERCIHIGVDVFMPAGCPVYSPLDGIVHSFANRDLGGDYGPVIILQHRLGGLEFHSLYGHLSSESLQDIGEGNPVAAGECIGWFGSRPGNGDWPPHLHFQLIHDMQGQRGDYPGVVRSDELDYYRQNCPDPTQLLVAAS